MNYHIATDLMTPSSSEYVESALRTVGFAGRTHGFLPHSILAALLQFTAFLSPSFIEKVLNKRTLEFRDEIFAKQSTNKLQQ